jgi:hypothetical protein
VPCNQQQNQSERKVCDLKKRTILTLQQSNAPLIFWCFCQIFIVDCLNHTSVKALDWQTPKEKQDGHTPDISSFRFKFWEPVWYYESTAKYIYIPLSGIGIFYSLLCDLNPELWQVLSTILAYFCIILGISSLNKCYTSEKQSHNYG